LAAAASAVWGAGDFYAGYLSRSRPVLNVAAIAQIASLAIGAIVILILGQSLPEGPDLWNALAAGACGGFGLIALYRALSIGVMSIAAPISALAALVPFSWGLIEGDSPHPTQLIGGGIALAGALLAAREPSHSSVSREQFRKSVVLAGTSAVILGTGLIFLAHASPGGAMPVLVADRIATTAIILPLALIAGQGPRGPWKLLIPPAIVGLFDTSANALYIGAISNGGPLSMVGLLASLYPVTTVLLARFTLKENLERHQAFGVGIALVGIALVAV